MNILTIISLICLLLYIELGIYVLAKSPKTNINRAFFSLSLCLAIWSFAFVFIYEAQCPEKAYQWYKVSAVGWGLAPAFMIKFLSHLTNYPKKNLNKNILFYTLILLSLYIIILVFTKNWIINEFKTHEDFWHLSFNYPSIYFSFYMFFILIFSFLGFFLLIRWRKNLTEYNEIKQFNIIFTTLIITFVLIVILETPTSFLIDISYPLTGHLATIIHLGGLAYAMNRFKLFSFTPEIIANKLINKMPVILIFFDTNKKILRINKYTEQLTGFKLEKIYGKHINKLFSNDEMLMNQLKTSSGKGESGYFEANLLTSDGGFIPVKIFLIVIKDEFNNVLGYVANGYDYRETISLEEEIKRRKIVKKKLKNTGDILEYLVRDRNKELEKSYKELQVKIAERMRIEEQIKSDISEKEILINEIHNRVIDNMNMIISLINMQTPHKVSIKTYSKLQELNQRIRSMLLVHNNLYLSINYSDVDFANFLNITISDLLKFYKMEEKIVVKKNISDIFLNIDYAIPLGLIASELISNALIHSFPKSFLSKNKSLNPSIFINYTYDNEYYYFIVSDNGKGLPKKFNIEKLKTAGLQLVDILVKEQINGNWIIKSDEGVFIRIALKSDK